MDAIAIYKLDRCKYQVMLVYKVVFTNLAMWVGANNHYSPTSYAHATGSRPVPFFQLSGRIMRDAATVRVKLRPFNDCTLNHDLTLLCARVNYIWQRLPDGRIASVRNL